MRFWRILPLLLLLSLLALPAVHAQEPDADGDGIPDSADFCWLAPGTAEFSGCTADNYPDLDQDGVGDPVDTCIDQPGAADNSGCPVGVTPDLDLDGIPDSVDACPREAGSRENGGCPPDVDGDGIPDQSDACPDQAGSGSNLGCPDGVRPRDSDGDGVVDLLDACPNAAGSTDLGGCPDRDGDSVPDTLDACPDQAGQSDLFGCAPVTTTTLPANRAALVPANAGAITEIGRLVVGIPRFSVATNGTLALRASDNLLTYDLNAAQLSPLLTVNTAWSGYPVAISGDARYLASLEFPPDFSAPPFAEVRDGASGSALYPVAAPTDASSPQLGISTFAFNPVLPLLALAETSTGGFTPGGVGTPVLLWDVANNRSAGQLPHPNIVVNLAFSSDGTKLAADTADGENPVVYLWDVGTQTRVAAFQTTTTFHFLGTPLALNRDGSRVAVGLPDGSFSLWQVAGENAAQVYNVPLFNQAAGEVVSAVAFSPDSALIAVAGGVPFSGGLTGTERFPIFVLDAASGATLAQLDGHGSLIHDLAFSPDGRLLISAGDSSLKFWGVSG